MHRGDNKNLLGGLPWEREIEPGGAPGPLKGFFVTETEFLAEYSIPPKYRMARLKDHTSPLNLESSYFFFSPTPGNGKTHLAWAFVNEFLLTSEVKFKKVYRPAFWTFGEIQLRLRASIGNGKETEEEVVDELSGAKLLILDDVGGMRPKEASDYSLSVLFEILNNRYSWERQTIITSNQSLGELSKVFDDRIASRIAGMCVVQELKGSDRRVG